MKFLVFSFFSGILLLTYGNTFSQSKNAVIQGKVTTNLQDKTGPASVILLSAKDSSALKSTVCDNAGDFKFEALTPGNYLILATKLGYTQLFSGPYKINTTETITVAVTLTKSYPELKEVSVTTQRPYVEVRADRVVLNVAGSAIAQGNSVFDVLRQAPGVKVGNNGDISIIGHQNALITIDGKPTTLTGENLAEFMQSLQSSNVQQIELITSGSAKYDAAGAGIINIVSKKGTNAGTNGSVTFGAGVGNYYKASGSVVFNSRSDKVNVFGNYTFTPDKTFHSFQGDRLINYQGINTELKTNYFTSQQRYNNNFRIGADYYITDKQTLGVIFYGTASDNNYDKRNSLKFANNGNQDSTIYTNSNLKRSITNLNYDVNYNGVLDSKGKTLAADFLYNNYDRHSDEYITNNFYNATGVVYKQPLLQQNISPSSIDNWIVKVDYTNPISKTSNLEVGFKYSYLKSNNDLIFGPQVNGVYQSDPKFSNSFLYTENVNSGYVSYTNKMGKLNLIAGLRADQTNATGNSLTLMQVTGRNYLDFFPNLRLTYTYDDKNEFSLSYNRGIQRPPYTIINPFLVYTDSYDYKAGNPNLDPQYSNLIELTHNYDKIFTTTLYTLITTGFYNFLDYMQNDATKVNVATNVNFGVYSTYGIKFNAPVQFASWWNANFAVNASYRRIKAYAQYGNLNKGTQDIEPTLSQTFKIDNTLTFELVGKYTSPDFYGINAFKANSEVDAGLSKQLFNKAATLRLSISDIFNTNHDRGYANYQNINYSVNDKMETRVFRANFIYRFGKSVKSVTHKNANEEEQRRVGG